MSVSLVSWMHLDWFFTFIDWPGVSTEADNRNTSYCRQCTSVRRINMASLDQRNNIFFNKHQSWGIKKKTNKQRKGTNVERNSTSWKLLRRPLSNFKICIVSRVFVSWTVRRHWRHHNSRVMKAMFTTRFPYYYFHLFIEFIITVNVIQALQLLSWERKWRKERWPNDNGYVYFSQN